MAKFYDVSMPIHAGMPVYKNRAENRPRLDVIRDFSQGAFETRLNLYMHSGTHMDAPYHFVFNGEKIDAVTLDEVIRPCRVLDLTHVSGEITPGDLEVKGIHAGEFILLKTRNSFQDGFVPDFVFLGADGAKYLVERGVKGVGIDALSVERDQPGHTTHHLLLGANILILEGLRLADVPEGTYMLLAAPLVVVGAEAAPVRVVLVEGRLEA
ncbi:MAG: cyclase family protein [Firmicutes bacterium]|nr:cyclase family protein [Bacillota bacterium]